MSKDPRFQDLENMVYLDIDEHYFTKPITHPIFYRRSASGTGFHLAFKRDWLTDNEFFLLLRQCDHDWLCKCIVDGQYRIAKNKNGESASEWRLTLQLTDKGKVQSHTKKILTLLNKYPKKRVAIIHYDEIPKQRRKLIQKKLP